MLGHWREVEIKECGQALDLVQGSGLFSRPAYLELGYRNAPERIWVRSGCLERLRWAAALLPGGYSLVVWDGWRSLELQEELYQTFRRDLAEREGLEDPELEQKTLRFVARPSSDPPSPHLTGGAVDLTLGDHRGEPLDMGGGFDELSDRSRSDYYETSGEQVYRDRRRILRQVMLASGWSNYPEEWWHYDYGNQAHHFRRGGSARYGEVKPSFPVASF